MHDYVINAIHTETKNAQAGEPAHIIAKMNSLLEPDVIRALYAASTAGVKIDLIVRGVCALRPGVKGLSENIKVRSVIGRFLEHSRIFYFKSGGADLVYISSADWMDRNFFRRIEIATPVLSPKLKKRVINEGLLPYLSDNTNAWEMDSEGNYTRLKLSARSKAVRKCAQADLLAALGGAG